MTLSCAPAREPAPPAHEAASPTLGITVAMPAQAGMPTRSRADFEQGEGPENYLDIENGNFRIYFFDTDGKYLDTFRPYVLPVDIGTETTDGVPTTYYYRFLGDVPLDFPSRFKIVTLFNWPAYPDASGGPALVKGTTMISDICTHASSKFARLDAGADGAWLDAGAGRLMPFYGVREYDMEDYLDPSSDMETYPDGTTHIKDDIYIDLSRDKSSAPTALPLLRGMAKVEVILDNPMAAFESVTIDRVNPSGFCAPENALNHYDYYNGYDWNDDFMRALHLPGGANSPDAASLQLTKVSGGYDKEGHPLPGGNFDSHGNRVAEKWVAYIPEYRNISEPGGAGAGGGYCSIRVTLANPDPDNIRNPEEPAEGPDGAPDTRPEWNPDAQSRTIYFATGGSAEANAHDIRATRNPDGTLTQGRFNIERNNIYRFTVTDLSTGIECKLDVQPYAERFLTVDLGLMRDESGDLMVVPDEEGNLPQYFREFADKESKWPKVKDADLNDTAELLIPMNDGNNDDYYAIRLDDKGLPSEIWLKDSDGCRVLSNFSTISADDSGCSARRVMDYSGITPIIYNKDKDGHQRLQHNTDHSSVVLNHEKIMLFKTSPYDAAHNPIEVKYYLVESWEETGNPQGIFWYRKEKSSPFIATEENLRNLLGTDALDDKGNLKESVKALVGFEVEVFTFQKADITGNDTADSYRAAERTYVENEDDDKAQPKRIKFHNIH